MEPSKGQKKDNLKRGADNPLINDEVTHKAREYLVNGIAGH